MQVTDKRKALAITPFRPDDRRHPWDSWAQSRQSTPSTAPPAHLYQEQFFAGLFALTGILGVNETHLLHWKARRVKSKYFAKIRESFSDHP